MTECNQNNLGELVMRALTPEDRPEDVPDLMDHVRNCPSCTKELELHRHLRSFVLQNRVELEAALSECPDSEALVQFAMNRGSDPKIAEHITYCSHCREELELLDEFNQAPADDDRVHDRLTVPQWGFVRNMVAGTYGSPPEERPGLVQRFMSRFREIVHVPSLAAGALAAALVMLVVLPRPGSDQPFSVALSDVTWKQDKAVEAEPAKKVAVVVLQGKDSPHSSAEIDSIYKDLYLAAAMSPSLTLISPSDLRAALAGSEGNVHDLNRLRDLIVGKTDASYLLAFQIGSGQEPNVLKGSLMDRANPKVLATIVQTGISSERLPDRIQSMAIDLLSQADGA